jgi:transcription termination factor Rho
MNNLDEVLAIMPYRFTVHFFRKIAKDKFNISLEVLTSRETKEYLIANCIQTNMFNYKKITNDLVDSNEIEKAIKLLKSTNNYKILKRVNDWNEI